MNSEETQQRSLDWFRARMGFVTGSKVGDLMKAGRKKDEPFSATAKAYLYQLAGERIFNQSILGDDNNFGEYIDATNVTSKAMRFGTEMEPRAKEVYMANYHPDADLIEQGSCRHESIEWFAASPDGIVRNADGQGNQWIVEVKCPNINTYMQYKTEIHDAESLKAVKPEYYWQVMAEMDCCKKPHAQFVAYCPWLTEPLHVADIDRNEDDIKLMEERVVLANDYIAKIIGK